MIDTSVKLIATTTTQNDFGALVVSETERDVMCEVKSVSMTEFYQAAQAGLSASQVFVTHPANYSGERILEYNGERYAITRTYQANADRLEIYTGEKVGDYGSDAGSEQDTD